MVRKDSSLNPQNMPSSIPVFPLAGALLLPGIEIPLNIFEDRYINMVDDALAEKRIIGMIQPKPSLFSGLKNKKPLYEIGCCGKIKAFNETEDGRYLIVLSGVTRFKINEEIQTTRGYRRFKVSYNEFSDDFSDLSQQHSSDIDRGQLIESIEKYLSDKDVDSVLNSSENFATMDLDFLVDFLCCYLPFSNEEKQLFIEARTFHERASTLLDVLGMAEASKNFKTEENNKIIH
jgi:hypothetical protein